MVIVDGITLSFLWRKKSNNNKKWVKQEKKLNKDFTKKTYFDAIETREFLEIDGISESSVQKEGLVCIVWLVSNSRIILITIMRLNHCI